ncbi:MAG: type II secretion system F family protein [Gemmatimonadetes bacterium]|nr:type II secretion system F family protein [Gemmatimonadota bacterium]
MPLFQYTARSATGDVRTASINAPSREEAVARLRRQRLTVIKVEEPRGATKPAGGRIPMRDVVVFTRQFATMVNAGLPLVQALDILARQSEHPALAQAIRAVVADVEEGNTVADAMRRQPHAFNELYTNMVAAGEMGGILDVILNRLAVFMEKADALVRKVKGAMIYPAVILAVAALCVVVLLWRVIPVFSSMFASVGMELPGPTKLVIALSGALNQHWWALLLGTAVAVVGARRYYATPAGRLAIDAFALRLPVLGGVLRKSAVSRFTRTLGTLVSSGVGILDALEITARTAGNRVVEDAVMRSRASIAGGDTIAGPLEASGVFPPMVISMIAVGEQTGGLDEMLSKVADFYDEEVDAAVSGLLSLLEPVMIVFLGAVVGGMIVAMYLPIFDMVNAVR